MTEPTKPTKLKRGRYELLRKLGEGSQGETWEAAETGHDARETDARDPSGLVGKWERYVHQARTGEARDSRGRLAIKCFRIDKAKAWKDVELAEREAETLASLEHPNLPKYIEHFEENGTLYLVMEKIEGETLSNLRARGRSSHEEVTRMLEDIGGALRYLHGRSPLIVHRDVKPGNVIRRPDGSYALVDFGAVRDRLKPQGGSTVVGTFGFMAPEQFQGRASAKSDLYGLAATALSVLTGEEPENLPHEGLGIDVLASVPVGTPRGLVRALSAMLVPDPDRRIDTIEDALELLHEESRPAPRVRTKKERKQQRREERNEQKRQKRDDRAARRERRRERRERPVPIVPRLVARFGLLVALAAVWLAVGVVTPVVLILLSLLFGAALRRAAAACVRAARRAQGAIGRASAWLSGEEEPDVRVRVASEPGGVRIDAPHDDDAFDDAEHADDWMQDQLARRTEMEARRERMRAHARGNLAAQKRKHWGR
ncbi:Serine/threonine kinase [Labilithrix luteola]|uniref:non-specific serine/threonine protein kinase n=1 Tax=Labilithrix luteola TaxID=1391654 RepID=A0A0K1PNR5_9BACT|nr:serine/threonine-protein kinase [Labilithrix luteola]AKU95168.1 Serine/threonine kinase [Labilithrix luteola]